MEQLVELLKQIQELAGVAIEALEGAAGGAPAEGGEPAPSEQMAEGRPEGEGPPPEEE